LEVFQLLTVSENNGGDVLVKCSFKRYEQRLIMGTFKPNRQQFTQALGAREIDVDCGPQLRRGQRNIAPGIADIAEQHRGVERSRLREGGKRLYEDLGGNFERQACHSVSSSIELALG
jgi:hypothetical protein